MKIDQREIIGGRLDGIEGNVGRGAAELRTGAAGRRMDGRDQRRMDFVDGARKTRRERHQFIRRRVPVFGG